jgi:DNA-directed RNA polymerase specialized sigma24 family protein
MPDQQDKPSDMDLVKLAQKGDMEAFEELVARHRDRVYARA